MIKQTILWTALPDGSDGPRASGTKLKLSVFIAPRLWNSDASVTEMQLSSFTDFLDWPARVNAATFQVAFEGGPTLGASRVSAPPRSDLWQALFKNNTLVRPFVFEDLTGREILSFPAALIHDVIKDVYQRAATDPDYGSGLDLPGRDVWQDDPDLSDIARPTRPADPPPEFELGDPIEYEGEDIPPEDGEEGESPPWWQSCLFFFIGLIRKLLKALGIISTLSASALILPQRNFKPDGAPAGPMPISPKKAAFDQLQTYIEPLKLSSVPMPEAPEDVEEEYDFHAMVSSLGDYPELLRLFGLAVDLEVTLDANLPPTNSKVQVLSTLTLDLATTNTSQYTHCTLGDQQFYARSRPTEAEISQGLLRLNDPNLFQVVQTDVPSAGLKLQNMATNMKALETVVDPPPNRPESEGLPALQTTGISIIRPEIKPYLTQVFYQSYALNSALASLDGSPSPPPLGADPPPPDTDELYAEDLTRGYRIDVWDDISNNWHSLCQRIGTYAFPELPGDPLTLEDEGFVQMSTTEAVDEDGSGPLRAHESLFIWDGWSLCAPRPGYTILTDHTTGEATNPAVTPFQMEANFHAKPGTLPRLRFGYSYKLRARTVDLAGNSIFKPGDPAFSVDQPQITDLIPYQRCEPLGPPAMLLRSEPKEGESLETLAVRSPHDSISADPNENQTERHIAAPKSAQSFVELHGKFDLAGGMRKGSAGYDLASREAGTTTHHLDLTTNTMELLPGVQEVSTPEHSYWLQTGDTFDIPYLPDPCARGVLLLGMPGMASFEEIIEPNGLKVNKLPFQGDWPDPKTFRLRLVGIQDGQTPAQPAWDAVNRVLQVEQPQGETTRVRISCYFKLEDLEKQAIWGWATEAAPANLNQLRDQAVAGRNWLYLPFRTLLLVHAVQRPLKIPAIQNLGIVRRQPHITRPWRPIGDTRAVLAGRLRVDAKSTGQVDFRATWKDPLDDPTDPANDPTSHTTDFEMHVGEVQVEDPTRDRVNFSRLVHSIGDTKYHRVTYSTLATTRYREFFPAALTSDSQNLVRPTAAEVGTLPASVAVKLLDIPNNARPPAPKPLYVLPTFLWSESGAGDVVSHVRRGGGLRVYLERPWYSSGDNELLGVLVRPDEIPLGSEATDGLKKYTSEWGMDPVWPAAATAPLQMGDFKHYKADDHNLSLAEISAPEVHVVGYQPGYDSERKLWYCDVQLNPGSTYYPFVRLALSRFQPNSVPDAHLSPVVQADFCQVVPHRVVEYDLSNLSASSEIGLKISGPAYYYPQYEQFGSPFFLAGVQMRQEPDYDDELNWQILSGVTGDDLHVVQQTHEETIWEGRYILPTGAPRPLRILLLEYEMFWNIPEMEKRTDEIKTELANHARTFMARSSEEPGGMVPLPDLPAGCRLVFADELIIE